MYIVIEFQKSAEDTMSTLVTAYVNKEDANAKYHTILTSASKSGLLKHGATMLTETGAYVKSECYGTETAGE